MGVLQRKSRINENFASKDFINNPEDYIQMLLENKISFPYLYIISAEDSSFYNLVDSVFKEEIGEAMKIVLEGVKKVSEYSFLEMLYHCFNSSEERTLNYEQFIDKLTAHYFYFRYFFHVRGGEYNLENIQSEYYEISNFAGRVLLKHKEDLAPFFIDEKDSHENDIYLVEIRRRLKEIDTNIESNFFNTSRTSYSDLHDSDDSQIEISADAFLNKDSKRITEEELRNQIIPGLQKIAGIFQELVPCDLVLMNGSLYITLHFEDLEISNSRGDSTTIQSLFFFIPILLQRKLSFEDCTIREESIISFSRSIRGYVNKHKISDIRVPPKREEFSGDSLLNLFMAKKFDKQLSRYDSDLMCSLMERMYQHSHLSIGMTREEPGTFCIGTGEIYQSLYSFENNNLLILDQQGEDALENTISYYFYLIYSYLKYESVEGVPYVYISEKQSIKNAMLIISSEQEDNQKKPMVFNTFKSRKEVPKGHLLPYLRQIKGKEITYENSVETFLDLIYIDGPRKTEIRRKTKVFTTSSNASDEVKKVMETTREQIFKVCTELNFQRNTLNSLNFYKDILGEVTIFQTEKNVTIIQDIFMNLLKLEHLVLSIYDLIANTAVVRRRTRLRGPIYGFPQDCFLDKSSYFLPFDIRQMYSSKFSGDFSEGYKFFFENFETIFSVCKQGDEFLYGAQLLIDEELNANSKKSISELLKRYLTITKKIFKGARVKEISIKHLNISGEPDEDTVDFYFKGHKVLRTVEDNSLELYEELSPLIEENEEETGNQNMLETINKLKEVPSTFTKEFIKKIEDELSK